MISDSGEISPVHSGVKWFGNDSTSCIVWEVFDRKEAEKVLGHPIDSDNAESAAVGLTGWYQFYKGSGRAFGGEPSIRLSRTRVLVSQHRGLDI